jgi:hypothetical protein
MRLDSLSANTDYYIESITSYDKIRKYTVKAESLDHLRPHTLPRIQIYY